MEAPAANVVALGDLEVDLDACQASFRGERLDVSRTQVELLGVLIRNRHRVLSRDELADALGLRRGRSVDVLLSGLRGLLGEGFVRNVRARGWIVEPRALDHSSRER